jgi:excisionase family DNA binding protein
VRRHPHIKVDVHVFLPSPICTTPAREPATHTDRPLRDPPDMPLPQTARPDNQDDKHQPDFLAEPLLRADQVAELLAVKTSTIYELSRRRHDPLPCVNIGRSRRFHRPAVAEWAQAHTNT